MDAANVFRVSSLRVSISHDWQNKDLDDLASRNRCRSLLLEAGADPMLSSNSVNFINCLFTDGTKV